MKTPRVILYLGCVLLGILLGSLDRFAFPHYRIYVHDLGAGGAHMPVFLKFDNREGRAWKSQGVDGRWHEMTDGNTFTPPPLASEEKQPAVDPKTIPEWARADN